MSRRPQILFVTPEIPARTGNGLAIRAGQALAALDRFGAVHVEVVGAPGDVDPAVRARAATWRWLGVDADDHRRSWVTDPAWRRRAARLHPLPAATPPLSPAAVARWTATRSVAVDIVHVLRLRTALAVADLLDPATPDRRGLSPRPARPMAVLDADDDDVATYDRWADAGDEQARADADASLRLAETTAGWFDVVTAAALPSGPRPERSAWTALGEPVIVPNGIPAPVLAAADPVSARREQLARRRPGDPLRLVLVANMTYGPNQVAARRLAGPVAAAARRRGPVEVTLVGAADAAVEALAGPGVRVSGPVPDPGDALAAADAAVLALPPAGGTRIKVLEAVAAGLPVVATAGALEGLDPSLAAQTWVAETDEALAAAAWAVVDAPSTTLERVRAGREVVLDRYGPEVVSAAWAAAYRPVLDGLSRPAVRERY